MASKSKKRRRPSAPTKSTAKKRPRPAVDRTVVRFYAAEIERNDDRRPATVHVVRALTRQYRSAFPIALNTGTRPTVCRYLKEALGERTYARLCPGVGDAAGGDVALPPPGPTLPPLPPFSSRPTVCPEGPAVAENELLERFPRSADLLLKEGAQIFPLLEEKEVRHLVEALSRRCAGAKKPRTLSIAQGNGECGAYYPLDSMPALLRNAEAAARRWIERFAGGGGEPSSSPTLGTKAIFLNYGEGGKNYLHHDSSGTYQALLMLSVPGVDFDGGRFLLLPNRDDDDAGEAREVPRIKEFPFHAAGDLLVFRADKGKYLHGMDEVTRGTADVTRRLAVGLFQ